MKRNLERQRFKSQQLLGVIQKMKDYEAKRHAKPEKNAKEEAPETAAVPQKV